ncbi:MAG TPA: rhodanese-like domain-containing protein [Phycisphaerales bacterium]|nr:rhodanese-like domain-containing protein [Phycisphaerales bacterium]
MTAGQPGPPPPLDPRGLPTGYPFKPEWEITPRDARSDLADPAAAPILLDCRKPEEWQVARIAGAVLIPMGEIEKRADELETDEGTRDRPIIVHCHHGVRSMRVTAALRAMGFSDVRSMAGGIDLWSIDVDPGVPRY